MAKSATVIPPPSSKASRSPQGRTSKAAGAARGRVAPAKYSGLSEAEIALHGGTPVLNESTAVGRTVSPEEFLAALSAHPELAMTIANATAQWGVADGFPFVSSAASTDDESDIANALFAEAPSLALLLQTESWSNFTAHLVVKQGISSKLLVPLGELLGLNKADLADFLELDRGTIHRRIQMGQPLPSHAAESVLRLLELDRMAKDTFATVEDAAGWLRKAHPMLDGESPLEAAKTSFGSERVKEILTALKWGGVA